MKKFTKLCLVPILGFVAFATHVSAQITITSADLPSAGLTVTTATDSTSGYLPGNPSASTQTWNFGVLKHQKTAHVIFKAPGSWTSVFPGSNLEDSTVGVTGGNFLSNTSSVFSVVGSRQIVVPISGYTFDVRMKLSPVFVQANLPATYGASSDIGTSLSRGTVKFNQTILFYDSEKITTNITYSDTVDAYGMMTTPTGTYQVLRQNHHEVDIDSITMHTTGGSWGPPPTGSGVTNTVYHQYNWYTQGIGYILVQMNMNTNGTVKNIVWDSTAPAGINELSYNGKVTVFPNPCTSQITFTTVGNIAQYINVYDVAGRKLEQVEMKSGLVNVNTSSYASGMYLYTLNDKDGNIVDRGKFMVK